MLVIEYILITFYILLCICLSFWHTCLYCCFDYFVNSIYFEAWRSGSVQMDRGGQPTFPTRLGPLFPWLILSDHWTLGLNYLSVEQFYFWYQHWLWVIWKICNLDCILQFKLRFSSSDPFGVFSDEFILQEACCQYVQ